MKAKIEIYEYKNGEWGYRIKAKNGEILVHSEGYDNKGNAKQGVNDLLENLNVNSKEILIEEV